MHRVYRGNGMPEPFRSGISPTVSPQEVTHTGSSGIIPTMDSRMSYSTKTVAMGDSVLIATQDGSGPGGSDTKIIGPRMGLLK